MMEAEEGSLYIEKLRSLKELGADRCVHVRSFKVHSAVCPKSRERVVFITEEVSDMVDPYCVYFFNITTNENCETSRSKEPLVKITKLKDRGVYDLHEADTPDFQGACVCTNVLLQKKLQGQLQRGLGRLEGQVERCWIDSERSLVLIAECQDEVEKLGVERERLLNRIKEIDVDIHRLVELSDALQWDAHVKLAASSKGQYIKMLEDVNSMRVTIGLPPLAECHASVQAREKEADRERPQKRCEGVGRAGRSYKSCPYCLRQVSRNAVVCPHCSAHCSRPRKQKSGSSTNSNSDQVT